MTKLTAADSHAETTLCHRVWVREGEKKEIDVCCRWSEVVADQHYIFIYLWKGGAVDSLSGRNGSIYTTQGKPAILRSLCLQYAVY